ncbi:hypothetical protein EDB80DRAFT_842596 [Ilyonectria destructans]|nr:hypothetical protein EDB80DRAFT_842596 [Ilyonectria destructans]
MVRDEDREEMRRLPLRRELEICFEHLHLPALPPPLPRSSAWPEIHRPCNSHNPQVMPFFFLAYEDMSLAEVTRWVQVKRDELWQIGIQDGLACAAQANQTHIARYLPDHGGAFLHGAVVKAACSNRSLPFFELCVEHGHHPDQHIPSNCGWFGVALNQCIEDEELTRFLQNGASRDLGRFLEGGTHCWGERATPPMDRISGLPLDYVVEKASISVI